MPAWLWALGRASALSLRLPAARVQRAHIGAGHRGGGRTCELPRRDRRFRAGASASAKPFVTVQNKDWKLRAQSRTEIAGIAEATCDLLRRLQWS